MHALKLPQVPIQGRANELWVLCVSTLILFKTASTEPVSEAFMIFRQYLVIFSLSFQLAGHMMCSPSLMYHLCNIIHCWNSYALWTKDDTQLYALEGMCLIFTCWCMYSETLNVFGLMWLNPLRPRQNGRHFADDIFQRIFLNEKIWIFIRIS